MDFEIKPYDPSMREDFERQFIDYNNNDLHMQEEDPRITDQVLREKIVPLFLAGWEKGASSIALCRADGVCAGFVCFQVDSPESDWCKRPGWGLIREFRIAPEFRRRGWGKALAAYAEQELRKKTDRLYLTAHDAAAVVFWTACGFTCTGERNENGTYTMEK